MDRWKSTARKKLRHGKSQKGEDKRWRRSGRETVRREKMQVRKHCVFPMAPESLLKRWVQMRDEKLRDCGAKRVLK